jgi:hypothetical protein
MFLASQPLATYEGLNATTDLQAALSEDIEKGFQRQGGTIRNETIPLHEDIPEEIAKQQTTVPHLRPIDYVFSERSLKYLHTITAEYFKTPLTEAFNWNEAAERLGEEQEGEWFIVAFRSIRNEQADHKKLYHADALAHEEAIQSGGLLKVNDRSYEPVIQLSTLILSVSLKIVLVWNIERKQRVPCHVYMVKSRFCEDCDDKTSTSESCLTSTANV